MFLVTYITRAHSSGYENRSNKIFDTLEEAVTYIQGEWYITFCEINSYPDNWDEEDFGCPMPKREDFSLESINKIISKKYWSGEIFGPYSQYCGLVPDELHLEEIKK
jgi:hypothetical protein